MRDELPVAPSNVQVGRQCENLKDFKFGDSDIYVSDWMEKKAMLRAYGGLCTYITPTVHPKYVYTLVLVGRRFSDNYELM